MTSTYGEFVMHCSRALLLETWAPHPTLVASTSPSVTSIRHSNPVEANPPAADPLQLSRYENRNQNRTRTRSRESGRISHRPWKMTPEEALTAVNNFTSAFGYELLVKRSVDKKGVLKHVYYTCVRGGKLRISVDEPAQKRQRIDAVVRA